ncbi:MAG: FAD-dependent oxidoreductase, partial [Dysgonamonadaceae bacterium]|nr:FAD-dependent oxidoreductase [Dysgonamonadaceae bacterium]
PQGRAVVLAKTVLDSTGSADIAIAAESAFEYTGKSSVAVQGCGLGYFRLNDSYNNNDWTFIDDSDVLDVSRAFIGAKNKFRNDYYDVCKMPQTRERRRIVGEHAVSITDILNLRRYSDTISIHHSSFDTHGFTIDTFFTLKQPAPSSVAYTADVPLRSLLPQAIDGIVVTGLGASAHRDAMPVIRMQACLQNQGYAVGILAAVAAKEGKSVRQVNIKEIQRRLVAIGNLPERVLSDQDDYGFTDAAFQNAARTVINSFEGLEVLMTDTQRAIPLLKQQYVASTGDARVVYAQILAMLGIADGWKDLVARIDSYTEWDEGWKFTAGGQFGRNMSPLDGLIIALGHTKEKAAIDAVISKVKLLTPEQKFSHFRAVAIACELIGEKKASESLYNLLNMDGIRGNEVLDYNAARKAVVPFKDDVTFRNKALKELHLARALYRCGDFNGLGENILTAYANDLHGHYARHAGQILVENIK